MLRQEINLYQHFETPKTSSDLLTWKLYWKLNVGVLALLVIIYIFSIIENYYLKNSLKNLNNQLAVEKAEFIKAKNSLPQFFFNKDVNEAVNSMKKEIAAQIEIVSILSRNKPFSEDLMGLSRSIVPDVWLKKISIQKSGDLVVLYGDSMSLANLNRFNQNLSKDPAFAGYNVRVKEAKDTDSKDNIVYMNFEISIEKQ